MSGGRRPAIWTPEQFGTTSRMEEFRDWLRQRVEAPLDSYHDLHQWSVTEPDRFWSAIADFFDVQWRRRAPHVREGDVMPDVRWFPGAMVNYAEHALRGRDEAHALVEHSQTRERRATTYAELRDAVTRVRAGLVALGVRPGDRVAGYVPNISEAVTAFLATASIGAIWSACAPELGARAVIDRLGQIDPKVLVAADGYRFGGKTIDRADTVAEVVAALPSLTAVVHVSYIGSTPPDAAWLTWESLLARDAEPIEFEPAPFDHPLMIVYSSGTTGPPKPIVHGHGGILLEHLKWLGLHFDVRPGDRFFWFSTTSWIMWNVVVSALLHGATAVLFDGDPAQPGLDRLWRLAEEEAVTTFGVSAGFLAACRKADVDLTSVDLSALRVLGSTGSPLADDEYLWVYAALPDVMLSSASGGTDVATAFAGGSPLLPVYVGELSGSSLGVDAVAVDSDGQPVVGERGELIVRSSMPSMPVAFWGDDGGRRLRSSYYDFLPGTWRQGDWVVHTERRSWIFAGRSDATLNRGGVRLGTGEIYALLERDARIRDSLVVFLDEVGGPGRLVLFVELADDGADIDDGLVAELRARIREQLSPRHVPDEVRRLPRIPKTLSGKKLEVPVKRVLMGEPPADVVTRDSISHPEVLDALSRCAPGSGAC